MNATDSSHDEETLFIIKIDADGSFPWGKDGVHVHRGGYVEVKNMTVRMKLCIGLLVLVLMAGCTTPVPKLQMEVSSPETAHVGGHSTIWVLFENRPQEGFDIEVEMFGFGADGPPIEIMLEMPALAGASGDRKKVQLLWENSNGHILGVSPEPMIPPQPNDGFGFSWEAMAAGTTEMTLTLTEADGNVIRRTVTVVVVE